MGSEMCIRDSLSGALTVGSTIQAQDGFGYVPLGTILPWHKNAGGSPLALPVGWAECNGAAVAVQQSGPLDPDGNGMFTVPDLNGQKKFLRGLATSGVMEADQFQDHTHGFSGVSNVWSVSGSGPVTFTSGAGVASAGFAIGAPDTGNHGAETRPTNMSVVWIMRVR